MIKVKIIWFQDEFFFLLKLPLLSFVFNHHSHFEVSNTIKTAQRGAWAIVCSFVFKAGEIAVEVARRGDFPGEGLWRRLGLTFHRNVTPALREVCAGCRQRGVRMRAHAISRRAGGASPLGIVSSCLCLLRSNQGERSLTGVCLEQTWLLSSSPRIAFFK